MSVGYTPANPPDPGIDPDTLLKAEQAFQDKYAQIGGPPELPAVPAAATQPPPFVPDQAAQSPAPVPGDQTMPLDAGAQATAMAAPPGAPQPTGPVAAPAGPGDQTMPNEAQPAPAMATLGPPPAAPKPTGDPGQDYQNTIAWHRQLTEYQQQAQDHGNDLAAKRADLEKDKSARELGIEQNAATIRNDEQKRFAEDRARHQTDIDKAVTEKADAYKDLSRGNGFLDQSLGDKVLGAIIFMLGSRSAALQNVAAAQLGQVGNAQNEGLNTINRIMAQRYQQKKDRLAHASDAVMEARYGYKDAAENHRAATADLDSDLAANYRLAAKEAASQGAQLGSEEARQNGTMASTALLQKAAEAEAKMLQEREALGVHRETAAATNKLAEAHLGLAERTAAATEQQRGETNQEARERIALSRDQMGLAHADRQDAINARKEAAEARKAATEDARTARDPETGDPLGLAGSPRQVPEVEKGLVASHAYASSLRALADDAEKNGRVGSDLPIIGTEAGRRRAQLYADAVERGRPAMQLGVSNANLQLEHQGVGGSGVGLDPHQMADPKVLRKMADEQDALAAKKARGTLAPINGKPVAPIAGREMSEAKPTPATAPATPAALPKSLPAPGGVRYEMRADGNYHKVK